MAFVQNNLDDEEQQKANQQQGPETVLSSDAPTPDGGQSAPANSNSKTSTGQQKGTGWTNLVQYVNANKEAGQQMANRVSQSVAGEGASAQKVADQYKTTAADTIGAATPKLDQSIITDLANDPTKITGQRADTFKQMRDAAYSGPTAAEGIQGYTDTDTAYKKTAQDADALENFEGRRQIIKDAYAPQTGTGSNYTAGQQRLDSFLTGTAGGQQLHDTRGQYGANSATQKGWGDLLSKVAGDIGAAQDAAKQVHDTTNSAYDKARGAVDSRFASYADKASNANAANATAYQQVNSGLQSKDPSKRAAAFKSIGLDPAAGEWLMSQGYKLPQLVAAGAKQNAADYASKSDLAALRALAALNGDDVTGLTTASGSTGKFKTKQDAVAAANQARAEQNAIAARLAQQQAARQAEADQMRQLLSLDSGIAGGRDLTDDELAKFGMDRGAYDNAQKYGLNLGDYYSRGRALTAGDIATDTERKGWAGLMAKLGLGGGSAYSDRGDEGAAWRFDAARLANDIAAKQAPLINAAEGVAGGGLDHPSLNIPNLSIPSPNISAPNVPGVSTLSKKVRLR